MDHGTHSGVNADPVRGPRGAAAARARARRGERERDGGGAGGRAGGADRASPSRDTRRDGLAIQDSRRRYLLGPATAVLADGFARQGATDHLLAPLRALAEATGETAYLAMWGAGGEIRALSSVEGANPVRVAEVATGPYRDAHARATGKLLLAYARPEQREAYLAAQPLRACTPRTITDRAVLDEELAAIRRRGHSEDREEYAEGVACVSAPAIRDGVILAAYTVSAPVHGYAKRRAALRAAVLEAARAATEPDRKAA